LQQLSCGRRVSMKKIIVIFVLALFMAGSAWAGPFGFDPHMSKEEVIKAVGVEHLEHIYSDFYEADRVPVHLSPFSEYHLIIHKRFGLVSVSGEITLLKEDILKYHQEWVKKLTDKYGECSDQETHGPPKIEGVDFGNYVSEIMIWSKAKGKKLGRKVKDIRLIITKPTRNPMHKTNPDSWDLSLSFQFKNFDKWNQSLGKVEKDAY
jgi:hypothetical protein